MGIKVSKMQDRSKDCPKHTVLRQILKIIVNILQLRLFMSVAYLFQNFTGFYNKTAYQFSCFKAIYQISALRNCNGSVSGRCTSVYHYSIQEVYLSNAAQIQKFV